MWKVTLGVSNLQKSVSYWSGLLGMKVYEKDEEKQRALLGYADNQVSPWKPHRENFIFYENSILKEKNFLIKATVHLIKSVFIEACVHSTAFLKKAKLWFALVILPCWEVREWGIFGITHILEKKLQCP